MMAFKFTFEFHGSNPKMPLPKFYAVEALTLNDATSAIRSLFPLRMFRLYKCEELAECECV